MIERFSLRRELAEYMREAARQRHYMTAALDDVAFTTQGGTIFYSVDVDVAVLYSSPVERSLDQVIPTGIARRGYAKVFGFDPQELSVAIGMDVSRFIFFELTGAEQPLFIFPPLERELGSVFAGVFASASQEDTRAEAELRSIESLALKLKGNRSSPDTIVKILIENAPTLSQILIGTTGPSNQLVRLSDLLQRRRIVSMEEYSESLPDIQRSNAFLFEPIREIADVVRYLELKDMWQDLLKDNARSRRQSSKERDIDYHQRLTENDAEALARLQWMNEHSEPSAAKVLHITGSPSLHRAADRVTFDDGSTFAERYLRHPRTYLGARDKVKKGGAGRTSANREFADLLDVFLAKRSNANTPPGREELRRLAATSARELARELKPVVLNAGGAIDDFKRNWIELSGVIAARSFMRDFPHDMLRSIPKSIDGTVDVFDVTQAVSREFERVIVDRWSRCFGAITKAGFSIVSWKRSSVPLRPRGVPPLCFNSCKTAEAFVNGVMRSSSNGADDRQYEGIIEKLGEEDGKTGYLFYLCFSYLFASAGRWAVAFILSERAFQIAAGMQKPHQTISGREAAFLMAVTRRHSVATVDDLEDCDRYLEFARKCLAVDVEGRPGLDALPVRFELEALAIDLSRNLFALLDQASLPSKAPSRSLSALQAEFGRIMPQVMATSAVDARENMRYRINTYILCCYIFRHFVLREQVDICEVRSYFEGAGVLFSHAAPNLEIASFLDITTALVVEWWLSSGRARRLIEQRLVNLLSDENINEASVMPYDIAKYNVFRDIVSGVVA